MSMTTDKARAQIRRAGWLVGLKEAAKIVGVAAPNLRRDTGDRMPEGIPVGGAADVYFKVEVEKLARELAREREKRGNNSPAKRKRSG